MRICSGAWQRSRDRVAGWWHVPHRVFGDARSILKFAACSPECFVLALVYIDRLIRGNRFVLSSMNVHRVIITRYGTGAAGVSGWYGCMLMCCVCAVCSQCDARRQVL